MPAPGSGTNNSITIDASISGRQDIAGYELKELKNSDSAIIKIISDVGFAAKALFSSGPIPPKVEQETTYTVVWGLSNSSNTISKGIVRSSLPGWVKFAGSVSPANENFAYNSSTREITWNVGNIPRGTGITTGSREVSFRIILAPSLSQLGTAPTIINEAVLTGHDDFANVDVRVYKSPLSTRLVNDPSFPQNGDRVIE